MSFDAIGRYTFKSQQLPIVLKKNVIINNNSSGGLVNTIVINNRYCQIHQYLPRKLIEITLNNILQSDNTLWPPTFFFLIYILF